VKGGDGVWRLVYGGLLADLQAGTKTAEQMVDDNVANLHTWAPNDPDYARKLKDALATIA
jgi:hypothetical protein